MAEGVGEGEHPSPPPGDDGQQSKLPKVTLRTPPKRADIPRLDSVVKLMTHDFSSRQRQRLASNNAFKAITENCGKFGDKPRKLAVCCSRQLCRKEHTELIACVRATRDASMCHEFRDEVERCGAKMSQRMLRAALADDWF